MLKITVHPVETVNIHSTVHNNPAVCHLVCKCDQKK